MTRIVSSRSKARRKRAKKGNKHKTSGTTRKLRWSDEFTGATGASPDSTKWVFDIGGSGFGNHEKETYTDRSANACLDGKGNLVITALRETLTGPDGIERDYTSARIKTQGKFSCRFGRVEARIQSPSGQGIWPAFWMLGTDIGQVGWAGCGEIDIFEVKGGEPTVNHGSLHGPGYEGGNSLTESYTLPGGKSVADDFHVYAVEWEPGMVKFFVDDVLYSTRTSADIPGKKWVFDHDFFIIFNLAVGGDFGGDPDATTVFPQRMMIDYVRVYE
jgi:beta-glucanase (GH16 family)